MLSSNIQPLLWLGRFCYKGWYHALQQLNPLCMITWRTMRKLCRWCADPSPAERKISVWNLKAISCWENSKGMSTKNSRELKLMAAATYNAFSRNPINFPASLEFCTMSYKKAIIHLKWCIVSSLEKAKGVRIEAAWDSIGAPVFRQMFWRFCSIVCCSAAWSLKSTATTTWLIKLNQQGKKNHATQQLIT